MGEVIYWDQVPQRRARRQASVTAKTLEADCKQALAHQLPVRMTDTVGNRNYKTKKRLVLEAAEHGCEVSFSRVESVDPDTKSTRDHIYVYPKAAMPAATTN